MGQVDIRLKGTPQDVEIAAAVIAAAFKVVRNNKKTYRNDDGTVRRYLSIDGVNPDIVEVVDGNNPNGDGS